MYANEDEMRLMAQQAAARLQEQAGEFFNEGSSEDPDEDIYAEFRQYEDGDNGDHTAQTADEYYNQEGGEQEVDVYYGPIPELDHNGEYEEVPSLNSYDEPLFEGGPGKIQVEAWKKKWAGYNIFVVEILTDVFVVRTLNRFEYKQLISLQNLDALQREEVICQTATLWPTTYTWKEMATDKAGVPSKLSDIIMEQSGFTNDYAIQII